MPERVIVVAVHPDDETLGCGGTLLKHKAEGDEVYWAIVTEITEGLGFSKRYIAQRNREIKKVSGLFGFDGIIKFGVPAMHVDSYDHADLVTALGGVFSELAPTVVYLPFKNDIHSDHRKVFEAAYSCTKSFRYPSILRTLMMETLSESEYAPAIPAESFVPNVFVDISPFLEKKLEIMSVYADEIGEHPFPRSLTGMRALATLRGASAGCAYAEGFMLLKEIRK